MLAVDSDGRAYVFQSSDVVFLKADELQGLLRDKRENRTSFYLVDLRLEVDFAKGTIEGAENIPLRKLRFVAEKKFQPKDKIIFFGYSSSDKASFNAAILLKNKGYSQICFFEPGYRGWEDFLKNLINQGETT